MSKSDDLISRRAAIDALDALCDRECEYSKKQRSIMCGACHLGSAFDVIERLPSAQPEDKCGECDAWNQYKSYPRQQWIPCSERLPNAHDEVLVTARGEVSIAWLYVDGKWRSNDMPQPMFRDIIAWMPLPKPYWG